MRFRSIAAAALSAALFVATPAAAQDNWQTVGTLAEKRVFTTATLLPDGRILVAGGADFVASTLSSTSEVFDPVTGNTAAPVAMPSPRWSHGAVLLANGRVLIAGGADTLSNNTATAALFDPVANTWTATASMAVERQLPLMARLPDGRVLVAGGADNSFNFVTETEIFDPATNTFSAAAPLTEGRYAASIVTLADGRLLVIGGSDNTISEIYNPATGLWTAAAGLPFNRAYPRAALMTDGRVIVAGGFDASAGQGSTAVDIYDPASDTWTTVASMTIPRAAGMTVRLPDGRILAAGALQTPATTEEDTSEIYDPATNTWSFGPAMPIGRGAYDGVIHPNGGFYVFGGVSPVQVDRFGTNRPPVANAGADVTVNGCNACTNGALVSGSASTDPDGDALTYTWSLGATVLAVAIDPMDSAILALPIGTHTVTLTVRDGSGAESTDTLIVKIVSVDTAYQSQIAALQIALAACEAGGGSGAITPLLNGYEQHLRAKFRDPRFELPGATSLEELAKLLKVLERLDSDTQKKIYRALGGRKKHEGHRGRWSPHWDDDCDWDDDDDRDRRR